MIAVVKRVGFKPEIVDVEDSLVKLQAIVGGYLESVFEFKAPGTGFSIVCYANEDGKMRELPFNFHRMRDREPICGDVVFVGIIDGEQVPLALETADQLVRLITTHSPQTDCELSS